MKTRSAVCLAIFIVAYAALYPGLTRILFSAYAGGFLGFTLVDIKKSTFGTIHMLMKEECYMAAYTILICSVVAPFIKLTVLVISACSLPKYKRPRPAVIAAIPWVRKISKWATVDAFTATLFVGFFCNSETLKVKLHTGIAS